MPKACEINISKYFKLENILGNYWQTGKQARLIVFRETKAVFEWIEKMIIYQAYY